MEILYKSGGAEAIMDHTRRVGAGQAPRRDASIAGEGIDGKGEEEHPPSGQLRCPVSPPGSQRMRVTVATILPNWSVTMGSTSMSAPCGRALRRAAEASLPASVPAGGALARVLILTRAQKVSPSMTRSTVARKGLIVD